MSGHYYVNSGEKVSNTNEKTTPPSEEYTLIKPATNFKRKRESFNPQIIQTCRTCFSELILSKYNLFIPHFTIWSGEEPRQTLMIQGKIHEMKEVTPEALTWYCSNCGSLNNFMEKDAVEFCSIEHRSSADAQYHGEELYKSLRYFASNTRSFHGTLKGEMPESAFPLKVVMGFERIQDTLSSIEEKLELVKKHEATLGTLGKLLQSEDALPALEKIAKSLESISVFGLPKQQ